MLTVYNRITKFNEGRLPNILRIKYKIMGDNVFSFFRGTCHLFYEDLPAGNKLPTSPLAWICGDLHLENFGSFKGDNHQVYFDLNDFDESLLAPVAWDIARMITSIFVGFKSLHLIDSEAIKTAQLFLDTFSTTLAKGKARYMDIRTAEGITQTFLGKVEKRKQKELIKKLTANEKGKMVLHEDEKHLKLDDNADFKKDLENFINGWLKAGNNRLSHFKVIDSIFRIAGTGSLGLKRYLLLLKSSAEKNRYLLLDMKEAPGSSLQPYVTVKQQQWQTEAERTITIQALLQNVSPALLSAVVFKGEPYVLKQMQPTADKIDFEVFKKRYDDIDQVIRDMAILTASAYIRSSGRQGSAVADDLIAFGHDNTWHKGVLDYALGYTKQVGKDYKDFVKESGKSVKSEIR